MNAARPLSPEQYKTLLAEIYQEGKTIYQVDLDADPASNPKLINAKLERVQAYKNRVVTILNQAVSNEAFWSNIVKKLDARLSAITNVAMVTEAVKSEKNAESRKAAAAIAAERKIVETLFQGAGEFTDHYCKALDNRTDAQSFLTEVEHIFKNLDSTDMNLAVQQKNVLMCTRLASEGERQYNTDGVRQKTLEDREEDRATSVSIG